LLQVALPGHGHISRKIEKESSWHGSKTPNLGEGADSGRRLVKEMAISYFIQFQDWLIRHSIPSTKTPAGISPFAELGSFRSCRSFLFSIFRPNVAVPESNLEQTSSHTCEGVPFRIHIQFLDASMDQGSLDLTFLG